MTAADTSQESGWRDGLLALADGSVFEGEVLGFDSEVDEAGRAEVASAALPAAGPLPAAGEVVFNTVMTGYQEVLTDPSYAGQIIAFTYPHIGNYGVAPDDNQSCRPFCRGLIVRELTERPSNWRAVETLSAFLRRHGLKAIAGVDTRRLTRQNPRRRRRPRRLRACRQSAGFVRRGGPGSGGSGRTTDRRTRPGGRGDLLEPLPVRRGPVRCGGVRLRDQEQYLAQPGRSGERDSGAGQHYRGRSAQHAS